MIIEMEQLRTIKKSRVGPWSIVNGINSQSTVLRRWESLRDLSLCGTLCGLIDHTGWWWDLGLGGDYESTFFIDKGCL